MTDSGLDLVMGEPEGPRGPGRRRADTPPRKPWGRRILALVVVVVLIAAVVVVGGKVKDRFFSSAEDYTGQGSGSVTVQIPEGAGGQQIANILKKAGVSRAPRRSTS